MNKRDDKQPPEYADVIELGNGTHAFISKDLSASVAVLYLHGNGESVVDLTDTNFLAWLGQRASFISPDYPGAGIGGSGTPTEASLTETALLARNELLRRVSAETKVCIWGRSLGAAVAAQAAYRSNEQIDCLILISPWSSFKSVASKNFLGRFISDKFHVEHGYNTAEVCHSIEMPTLIVHGSQDKLIPFEESERLKSCFKRVKFLEVDGFGHNDIYGGDVLQSVTDFLNGAH